MSTETKERTDLVWVVAEEPAQRRPVTIEISVDRPDALKDLKKLPMPALSAEVRAKIKESCSLAVISAGALGTALNGPGLGALRRSLEGSAEAVRYHARTGRPYPLCGPHRATITERYTSIARYTSEVL